MKLFIILLLISTVMVGFQNCGESKETIFTIESKDSPQMNPASMLLTTNSAPRINGFNPGPKAGERYKCNLETPISDLVFRGIIRNRVRINPFPPEGVAPEVLLAVLLFETQIVTLRCVEQTLLRLRY